MILEEIDWNRVQEPSQEYIQYCDKIKKYRLRYPNTKWIMQFYCIYCEYDGKDIFVRPDTKELTCPKCLNGYYGTLI